MKILVSKRQRWQRMVATDGGNGWWQRMLSRVKADDGGLGD